MSLLERENALVLSLVQALLGAPSRNFRRVGLRIEEDRVGLQVVLERESSSDREEIEELVLAFEALQQGPISLHVAIEVHEGRLHELETYPRGVYLRRED